MVSENIDVFRGVAGRSTAFVHGVSVVNWWLACAKHILEGRQDHVVLEDARGRGLNFRAEAGLSAKHLMGAIGDVVSDSMST
jgi:hypothetical protein